MVWDKTTIFSWVRCGKSLLTGFWLIFFNGDQIVRAVCYQLSNKKACQKRPNDTLLLEMEPIAWDSNTIVKVKTRFTKNHSDVNFL